VEKENERAAVNRNETKRAKCRIIDKKRKRKKGEKEREKNGKKKGRIARR